MVINAAATKAEGRGALQEVLPVRQTRAIQEEDLSIEGLRKELVEIDARKFGAEAEDVRALYPADVLDKVEIVLGLILVGGRCRSNLEALSVERKFINGLGDVVGGPVDAQIRGRDWRHIQQTVVHAHVAEPEFVHEAGIEKMRLSNA